MLQSTSPRDDTLPGLLASDPERWRMLTIQEIADETGSEYREVVNAISYLKSRYNIVIPHSGVLAKNIMPKCGTLPGMLSSDPEHWKDFTIREIAAETGSEYREVVNAISYLKTRYNIVIPHSDVPHGKLLSLKGGSVCMACEHYSIRSKCCTYAINTGHSRNGCVSGENCQYFRRSGMPVFICWPDANQYSLLFVLKPFKLPYLTESKRYVQLYEHSDGQYSLFEEEEFRDDKSGNEDDHSA